MSEDYELDVATSRQHREMDRVSTRLRNAVHAARKWRALYHALQSWKAGEAWSPPVACPLPPPGEWSWVEYSDGTIGTGSGAHAALYVYALQGGYSWDCVVSVQGDPVRQRGEINSTASSKGAAKRAAEEAAIKLWKVCRG